MSPEQIFVVRFFILLLFSLFLSEATLLGVAFCEIRSGWRYMPFCSGCALLAPESGEEKIPFLGNVFFKGKRFSFPGSKDIFESW